MIEIVPAAQQDILEWYGRLPPFSFRGQVAKLNGDPVAIYGVMRTTDKFVMFADFSCEVFKYRKTLLKIAKQFVLQYDMHNIYAVADEKYKTSSRFLEHLGFESVKSNLYVKEARYG